MTRTRFVAWKAVPLLAMAVAAFAAFAACAGAATPYPVQTVSESGQNLSEVSIGIDAEGNQVAVWKEQLPTAGYVVDAATRPSGGSWSAPVAISPAEEEIESVSVVVNASGEAAATWMRQEVIPNWIVEVAHMDSSGSWGVPTAMVPTTGVNTQQPQVGIDTEGDITVAWREYLGANWGVAVASQEGGVWGPSELLSDPSKGFEAPQLAVSPSGAALVTWGTSSVIEGSTRPAGGSWSPREVVVSPGSEGLQGIGPGIDSAGEATVAWAFNDGTHYIVQAATKPLGGSWAVQTVGGASGENRSPTLSVNAKGDALLAWIHGEQTVEVSERGAGGSWASPATIPAVEGAVELYAIHGAIDGSGDPTLAYEGFDEVGRYYPAWLSRQNSDGSWTDAVKISEGEEEIYRAPVVAANPFGDVAIAWAGYLSSSYVKAIAIENFATLSVTKGGTGSGTVTSDKGGIDCGTICAAEIAAGRKVTLTATPASGSRFSGWSGACDGADTCTVDMDTARSVRADFTTVGSSTTASTTTASSPATTAGKVGALRLVKVKRSKAHGTGVARYLVPAAGTLTVYGKGVKTTKLEVKQAGSSAVKLVPKGAYRSRLMRQHRGFSVVKAKFRPADGGKPTTWQRRIRLVWRGA